MEFQYKKKDISKLFQIKEYCHEIDKCTERLAEKIKAFSEEMGMEMS
jgi:hypothetical protein